MTPKEKMIEICQLSKYKQALKKDLIIKTLEEFLKEATIEDLNVLNCDPHNPAEYPGLLIFAEMFLLFGAYGGKFYNLPKAIGYRFDGEQ